MNVPTFFVIAIFPLMCEVVLISARPNKFYSSQNRHMRSIISDCADRHDIKLEVIIIAYIYDSKNRNVKCAVKCILQNVQMMDENGDIDKTEIQNVLSRLLPVSSKSNGIINAMRECMKKDNVKADSCERAYNFTKCITRANPLIPRMEPTF